MEPKVAFDATDIRILEELQENARLSTAELGRRVALSAPAVAERVRRLEDAGIIEGYGARVNLNRLGYPMQAIITLTLHTARPGDGAQVSERLRGMNEVMAAFVVTGPDCVILRVAVRDVTHLESVLERLKVLGRTDTSVVLSASVKDRPVLPPPDEAPPAPRSRRR